MFDEKIIQDMNLETNLYEFYIRICQLYPEFKIAINENLIINSFAP